MTTQPAPNRVTLGSYGSADEAPPTREESPVDLDFSYFGETIRVNNDFDEFDVVDLIEVVGNMNLNDVFAVAMMKELLSGLIVARVPRPADLPEGAEHDPHDDLDRFWAKVRTNRQTGEQLFALILGVVQAYTHRPSGPSSDSSPGVAPTAPPSEDGSFDRVSSELVGRGRPDLHLVAIEAQEAQAAAQRSAAG